MHIDVWSDIVCPWCYIGERRLDQALERFEHRDQVEVIFRSFQLDPQAPVGDPVSVIDHLGAKYGPPGADPRQVGEQMTQRITEVGRTVGIEFDYAKALRGNTFDAHRLLHAALDVGGPALQRALADRLFEAYFTEGVTIDDHAELTRLASEAGLPADRVAKVLGSDEFAAAVGRDVAEARAYGATGVPFFVLDDAFGVSGAQPPEVFDDALAQAWAARKPALVSLGAGASGSGTAGATGAPDAKGSGESDSTDGEVCGPDGCAV